MVDREESFLHGSERSRMDRWDTISSDILESIFERLDFVDKLNCGAVCSYWKCIAKSFVASRLSTLEERPLPLLVLENLAPEYSSTDHNVLVEERESIKGSWFYCPKTKNILKLNNRCEQFKMSTCVGSSNGWLVFTQGGEEGRDQTSLFLFNPHLDFGLRPTSQLTLPFGEHPIRNVILWGYPISADLNYNFAIVIITEKSIAFARYGDSNWTLLDTGDYIDVISSKNYVYALTGTCAVQGWDFSHFSPHKTLDMNPTSLEEEYNLFGRKYNLPRPFYLVTLNGQLSIVSRYRTWDNLSRLIADDYSYRLYKLNFKGTEWKLTWQCDRQCDRIIFLGKGQCVSKLSVRALSRYYNSDIGIAYADDPIYLGDGYCLFGGKKRKIESPAFWLVS